MSTLALAQRQIKREEKITGKRVSREKKEKIVEAITNKTLGETEPMPDDVCAMIERLKEIWSHVEPDTVEVIRRSLKITLEKLEKKTQSATESVKHRSSERLKYYGKASIKRFGRERAHDASSSTRPRGAGASARRSCKESRGPPRDGRHQRTFEYATALQDSQPLTRKNGVR